MSNGPQVKQPRYLPRPASLQCFLCSMQTKATQLLGIHNYNNNDKDPLDDHDDVEGCTRFYSPSSPGPAQ